MVANANKDRVQGGKRGGGLKEDLWQTNLWMLFTSHLSFTCGNATDCTVSKLDTYVEARNTILGLSCINPHCFYTIIYLISMIDWHTFI